MKLWKKISIVLLGIIIALILYNKDSLVRLSKVLSLFDEENIKENFLTMEDIFPHHVIAPSENSRTFVQNERTVLPEYFDANGTVLVTDSFLRKSNTMGLIVLLRDTIIHESYDLGLTEDEDFISWSVSKSIVSALVGIAINKKEIKTIHDPVDKYVPELAKSGYAGVSIKDVLQMSSGISFNEDYSDFNSDINRMGRVFALGASFDKFVYSLKSERKPGVFHKYVSMDTQVLGMVLREAVGLSLSEQLQDRIWKPMGAEYPAYWLKDSKGMEAAFGGLNCSLRDYARFGNLYANKGFGNGRQIIDSTWIVRSTIASEAHLLPGVNPASNSILGYGYQWWIPNNDDGVFVANGVYNQYIFVDSENDLVIVKCSANHHYKNARRQEVANHYAFLFAIRNLLIK